MHLISFWNVGDVHENKLSICFLLLSYLFYGIQSKGSIWHAVCGGGGGGGLLLGGLNHLSLITARAFTAGYEGVNKIGL